MKKRVVGAGEGKLSREWCYTEWSPNPTLSLFIGQNTKYVLYCMLTYHKHINKTTTLQLRIILIFLSNECWQFMKTVIFPTSWALNFSTMTTENY